ncbi:adenylate kinase domain-containing protein [Hirsutella rhossiliensis]|uniref:Uridylate kinase n=1 Tax=Hirsutella rhossiliensis TaxID=111463 RepID=A0A9P8MXR2_9HYPO|nr:adenylate kinase domain-containing protein [Hirsutella rhossiliensis]KAH0963190.1 adenylate kinase domain-containing protein [Hirsutella rhossiliensis]
MASRLTPFPCRPTAAIRRVLASRCSPALPRRLYSSEPPRPDPSGGSSGGSGNRNRIKFWPFVGIIALGSAGYVALVNRRKEMPPATETPSLPAPSKPTPAFSPDDVTVVFVLGGPGAGKGTQCARLVAQHGFTHLSAGDLLRAEQERPGSQFGDLIRSYIKDGLIVPMEVTVQLLENAMTDALRTKPKGRFLIDGFPRKMDQAHRFEEAVCPARLVLFYDCNERVMQERLLERGKTSGRADDNAESIRKRFRTFVETSMPVVDYYDKQGKVVKIDATATPDAVFADTQKRLTEKLGSSF